MFVSFYAEAKVEGKKHAVIIADNAGFKKEDFKIHCSPLWWRFNFCEHWLEERYILLIRGKTIGRRLVWLVCDLHTNELPLCHLIKELDGPTESHNKWSGPLDSTPRNKWKISEG